MGTSPCYKQKSVAKVQQEYISQRNSNRSNISKQELQEENVEYIQGEVISEGTNVYSALNIINGQLLAIKQFHLTEQENQEKIFEKVEILRKLNHQNIHQIIGSDIIDDGTKLLILMPYESGGSISWLLQKFSKFSPHLAGVFFQQILEGLDYLHQNNILHQNLKTSNVLVDVEANVKLSDVNILEQYQVSVYSAPECFKGGEYTVYSDVWSAGCIFVEMLTRMNPWVYQNSNITLEEIKKKLENGKAFQLKQQINDESVLRILQLIFKQDPTQRLTPQQLLEQDFFKKLQNAEIQQSILVSGREGTLSKYKGTKAQKSQYSTITYKSMIRDTIFTNKSIIKRVDNPERTKQLNEIIKTQRVNYDFDKIHQSGQSLTHNELQTVVSLRYSLKDKIIDNQALKHKLTNKLLEEGYIRHQTGENLNQVAQQLITKPPKNYGVQKSYNSKMTQSILHSDFNKIITDRSHEQQSDQIVENSPQSNINSLEQMINQQFYKKVNDQPIDPVKNLEDVERQLLQQFQSPAQSIQGDKQKQFEDLMAQQFADMDSESEDHNEQTLEDLIEQQFFQQYNLLKDYKPPQIKQEISFKSIKKQTSQEIASRNSEEIQTQFEEKSQKKVSIQLNSSQTIQINRDQSIQSKQKDEIKINEQIPQQQIKQEEQKSESPQELLFLNVEQQNPQEPQSPQLIQQILEIQDFTPKEQSQNLNPFNNSNHSNLSSYQQNVSYQLNEQDQQINSQNNQNSNENNTQAIPEQEEQLESPQQSNNQQQNYEFEDQIINQEEIIQQFNQSPPQDKSAIEKSPLGSQVKILASIPQFINLEHFQFVQQENEDEFIMLI